MKIHPLTFITVVLFALLLACVYIYLSVIDQIDTGPPLKDAWPDNAIIQFPTFFNQGAFTRNGRNAVFGYGSKLWLYDLSTVTEIRQIKLPGEFIKLITLAPDNQTCFTTSQLYNIQTGNRILAFDNPGPGEEHIAKPGHASWIQAAFSSDGKTLFVKESNGLARLWDTQTGTVLREIEREKSVEEIRSVAFSPDGCYVLTARMNGIITIWDATSGNIHQYLHHPNTCWVAIYSLDGKQILSAGDNGLIQIWNAQSGEPLQTYHHPNLVRSLCISNDGIYLAAGGQEGIVRIWDRESNLLIDEFKTDNKIVSFLGFTEDNQYLYASDSLFIYKFKFLESPRPLGEGQGEGKGLSM